MVIVRKPFQGVKSIIRFNWHFYALSCLFIFVVIIIGANFNSYWNISLAIGMIILITILNSIIVSFYVYDISSLYKFNWMHTLKISANSDLLNINAGFDETSMIFQQKFSSSNLTVLDFYDPAKHTEISIKRARKLYSAYPGTLSVSSSQFPIKSVTVDFIFVVFSAHEIRNTEERNLFFTEIYRVLKNNGKVIVIEHLRNLPNLLAYNIGFMHFLKRSAWLNNFNYANFKVCEEIKITPFVNAFVLVKNGN